MSVRHEAPHLWRLGLMYFIWPGEDGSALFRGDTPMLYSVNIGPYRHRLNLAVGRWVGVRLA